MTLILVFLVSVIVIVSWWLLRQGIMSKPWLETGPSTAVATTPGRPAEGTGLVVFLVVIGSLFTLFGSAFVMRMNLEEWSSLTLPPIIWINSGQLILASLFLHMGATAERRSDRQRFRRDTTVAAIATAAFLIGQLLAWRELTVSGNGLTTGPAASFFYLLSGLHGLHVVGGLGALGLVLAKGNADLKRPAPGIRLCVVYWDFLLVVWGCLLVLFLGGSSTSVVAAF